MRAITEIPANTPRPIGRTDNFFPGSEKAVWDAELAAAAEAAEAAEEDAAAESAAAVAEVVLGLSEELLEVLDVVEEVDESVGDAVAAGTVDTPYNSKIN